MRACGIDGSNEEKKDISWFTVKRIKIHTFFADPDPCDELVDIFTFSVGDRYSLSDCR